MSEETNNPTDTAQDNTAAEGSADTEKQDVNAEQTGKEDVKPDDNKSDEESKASDSKEDGDSEKKEKEDGEEETSAPEKYEAFDLPKGVTMSEEQFAETAEFAKSLNLSQEQAQQAVDYHNKVIAQISEHAMEQAKQNLVDQAKEWRQQVETDKEIGGAKMNDKVDKAMRVLNAFSDKATDAAGKPILGENKEPLTKLSVALAESGFGNHPEMVRAFSRIGELIGEDRFLSGKAPQGAPKTQADAMFPDHVEGV